MASLNTDTNMNTNFDINSNISNNEDIITLIMQDHRKILNLFDLYERTDDIDRREPLVRDSIRELSLHSSKEEMTLYDNLRKNILLPNGKEYAEHGWNEHEETKKLLYRLDVELKPNDILFDSIFRQIIKMMRDHIREEEEDLLPKIRNHCDEQKLIDLGKSYIHHGSIAVTRPHPSAPDKGLLGKMANVVTKPIDDLRDKIRNRNTNTNTNTTTSTQ